MKNKANYSNHRTIISVRCSVVDVRFDKNLPPIYSVLRAGKEYLHGTFHRLRQSGIDEELFDVIAGFEALKA